MVDVSIVLPCYNAHVFLDEAVASARAQTLAAREIIVIDDGSTAPETAAALAALPADVRLVHQENRGLGGARNRGFEEARGRYVLPLDCDDWIEPGYAEKALALIAGRDDAFVHPWIDAFGQHEAVLEKHWNLFEQLVSNQMPYCMLIPKTLWQRVGGYDESMRLGYEDWDFNIRLGLVGAEALCLPEAVFHYRVAASGMLQAMSHQRHGQLWRIIQQKHPESYSLSGLLGHMRAWSGRPRAHATWQLLAFYAAHRVLPDALFSRLFRAVLQRSHLRRAAAGA
ncbi:MAG: glycosyltransferase family 2 protein [Rhodospirillales bacterium]|nr:glycosyltransferase family 2 protein [Rhodospirillales bacterium]